VSLPPAQRAALIDRYERGPTLLAAAWAKVPADARQWRPGPGRWSAHEVVVHCADSESNAMLRVRFLLTEESTRIQAYDQAHWATALDYHTLPAEPALATVMAVRANTVPLLRRMTEQDWQRAGVHPESGPYNAERWLQVYAEHLEKHSGQIERTLEAWRKK
jgi:hypothetical protein